MSMILEGIRVIDWTLYMVGPYAAAMLADMGAEVIHVEQPGSGDGLRGFETFMGLPLSLPTGRHLHFEEHNRNKKSITADLKKAEGREIVLRLVEKSDVFLTNFRARVVKRLGLDYESLARHNPRLIYASASGYGLKGPEAESPSVDLMACARSGATMSCGDEGPPAMVATGIGDRAASFCLAYGIIAALFARERLGLGQEVHISQLSSMITLQGWTIMPTLLLGREYARHKRAGPRNPLYNFYQCRDGRWITLALLPPDRYWPALCQAMGRPDLEKDPRFDNEANRQENSAELVAILDQVFATKTYEEWDSLLKEGDLIFTVANRPSDLASDPQVLTNEYIRDWDHPDLGPIKFVGFPVEFSRTPLSLRAAAPRLGEHTEEVLSEVCSYTTEEIALLREREVI